MRYLTAATISLMLFGCERGDEVEPALVPAARTSPAAERAIESISAARCDHAQQCNTIGPTSEYMTREHCLNVMRADGFDELGVCRLGIDQDELSGCLAEIAEQTCGAPFDLARITTCRSDAMCLD